MRVAKADNIAAIIEAYQQSHARWLQAVTSESDPQRTLPTT